MLILFRRSIDAERSQSVLKSETCYPVFGLEGYKCTLCIWEATGGSSQLSQQLFSFVVVLFKVSLAEMLRAKWFQEKSIRVSFTRGNRRVYSNWPQTPTHCDGVKNHAATRGTRTAPTSCLMSAWLLDQTCTICALK